MKKNKIITALLIISVTLAAYKLVYPNHRNIAEEVAMFSITSDAISNEFMTDVANAELKYLNNTVEISGTISEINDKDLTIDETIFCQFLDQFSNLKEQQKITIKGRVIGFDDLLEQVKLDQCHIIH